VSDLDKSAKLYEKGRKILDSLVPDMERLCEKIKVIEDEPIRRLITAALIYFLAKVSGRSRAESVGVLESVKFLFAGEASDEARYLQEYEKLRRIIA